MEVADYSSFFRQIGSRMDYINELYHRFEQFYKIVVFIIDVKFYKVD